MADDGMLLNFEISDAPLKTQVKFKGGRWRDRLQAQRSAKQVHDDTSTPPRRRHATGDYDDRRPSKRPRASDDHDHDSEPHRFAKIPRGAEIGPKASAHAMRSGHASSGLFTSNPNAVTDFEQQPARVEETEPAKPSNAPLSEEAENFHSLGISRRVAQHLATKLEMKAPTAIQKSTVPQLIQGDSDAFLQAETGSGKTLAYLLPIVHRIMALSLNEDGTPKKDTKVHRNSGLFAIVLAPTRELCKQIAVVLEKVLRCAPWLVCTTVIGGESKKSEKARIRKGVNILIATPGRLADHLDNTKVLNVGTVRWLVLDEGDRMMEMGFEDDIKTIVGKIRADKLEKENVEGVVLDGVLPSRRVTVLCSATMKMNVQKLGEISLQDAIHIVAHRSEQDKAAEAGNEAVFAAPSQLKQSCIVAPAKLRLVTLIALLKSTFARKGSVMKAIVFISCADSVDFHYELLKDAHRPEPTLTPAPTTDSDSPPSDSAPPKPDRNPHIDTTVSPAAYITSPANPKVMIHKLHGSLAQPVRSATLHAYTTCKDPAVLITTDISSRGLDVPAVDLVIEYDPAFAVPDHVHRIGRTARAGRPGKAILFLMPGCEEGYTAILPASTPVLPQLYESTLQKGFLSDINLPSTPSTNPTDSTNPDPDSNPDSEKKQTWTSRAEALQLHLEQRLLTLPPGFTPTFTPKPKWKPSSHASSKSSKFKSKQPPAETNPLLTTARQAFRSHIRAYATHVREERVYFDITQLHLGHLAKSFGLRETPGGIGGGVVARRTTHKTGGTGTGTGAGKGAGVKGVRGGGEDDESGAVDEDAARRMREKMRMVMNASSEFNIG